MLVKDFVSQTFLQCFAEQSTIIKYSLAVSVVVATVIATNYTPLKNGREAFLVFNIAIIIGVSLGKNVGIITAILSICAANILILYSENRINAEELLATNLFLFLPSAVIVAFSKADSTNHAKATDALLEKADELELIMDSSPAVISYLDTGFRYIRANATYEKWFNVGVEKIIGQHVKDVIGNSAWAIVQPNLERARSGDKVSFDQVIPYGGGEPRWVHGTYVPIKGSNGKVKGIVVHVVDIEDRKQYEQKIAFLNQSLQQRVEEMQVIFDTVPIGLAIADNANGNHIRYNPANIQIFGCSDSNHHEPEIPSALRYRSGCGLEKEGWPMRKAQQGETITNQIIEVCKPDGTNATLLCNASPLFSENRKPRGAVGTFLDISALKHAEEALKHSQIQLRLFIEQAPVSIAMFDQEMNYLVTSRRWIDDFGGGNNALIGRNYYQYHDKTDEKWKQIHLQALGGSRLKNDEDLWILSDGSKHWLRWAAYPWTNHEEEIGGIIVSCEDITATHEAQEKLRGAQTRLALVVAEVNAGHWEWELDTNTVYLSPEYKQQIGYENHELENRYEEWETRLHPEDRNATLTALEDYINNLQPDFELRFRLRHRDGSYRWIHSRAGLLRDRNNLPYRMVGINLDVTDYIKTQELNERRNQMEQAFRFYVASQTAAAIAHELNQPLTAISYYADAAIDMLEAKIHDPDKLSQVVSKCGKQALRAGETIKHLLQLLHQGESAIGPIDINQSIKEVIDILDSNNSLKGCKLELDLAPGLPPVNVYGLQIQKVLMNMITNGLESIQESQNPSGSVIITSRQCNCTASQMLEVRVSDNGIGVSSASALKDIFQPFYTTKSGGLGMGLAISKAIIESHEGKMWATKNLTSGISVNFSLPFV